LASALYKEDIHFLDLKVAETPEDAEALLQQEFDVLTLYKDILMI